MRAFCISDLHLQDDDNRFLFTREKEAVFEAIVEEVKAAGATLVLCGDIFDLTGAQPPARGLAEFFSLIPPLQRPAIRYPRSVTDRVHAIARRHLRFFAALASLARDRKLLIVPGNHDYEIGQPEGRAALGAVFGMDPGELLFAATFRAGNFLVAAHGHEFDPVNKGNQTCVTSCLYHGLRPALRSLGVTADVTDAIACVRPEENIVSDLDAHLGERWREVVVAFVKLLLANGFFEGFDAVKVWVIVTFLPWLITIGRVKDALAADENVSLRARAGAETIVATHTPQTPEIFVCGHTHELDATPHYVNLGTWIDSVRGLLPAALAAADRTLPVLDIDSDARRARLYDAETLIVAGTLSACPVRWEYGEPRIRAALKLG